jgi:hypothetical protein
MLAIRLTRHLGLHRWMNNLPRHSIALCIIITLDYKLYSFWLVIKYFKKNSFILIVCNMIPSLLNTLHRLDHPLLSQASVRGLPVGKERKSLFCWNRTSHTALQRPTWAPSVQYMGPLPGNNSHSGSLHRHLTVTRHRLVQRSLLTNCDPYLSYVSGV